MHGFHSDAPIDALRSTSNAHDMNLKPFFYKRWVDGWDGWRLLVIPHLMSSAMWSAATADASTPTALAASRSALFASGAIDAI